MRTVTSPLSLPKQKKNKLIFVDAYASWCGPCKLMVKIFSRFNRWVTIIMLTLSMLKLIWKKEKELIWLKIQCKGLPYLPFH
ncbi:hypothetical protein EJ377_03270 [Chryseobacterium arthrosphaerae]|uniref:Thioredoxin domain-containing protein n=1 Tax=Chryseobacterium arthrosphaerae TaxID=651561 RepID=A0A432DZ96_9FLAO|nr:hypothetical protein EJ377_03270 [Chryseobacterium arthrosphaerae]